MWVSLYNYNCYTVGLIVHYMLHKQNIYNYMHDTHSPFPEALISCSISSQHLVQGTATSNAGSGPPMQPG